MTESHARSASGAHDDEVSLFALGSVLLRWRRTIFVLALLGAALGLSLGLLKARVYVSAATFIPQGSEAASTGLAIAASQFGIRIPSSSGSAWGPPVYVELLKSRGLLEPLAVDTFLVVEEGERRVTLMDLLDVTAPTPLRRTDAAVRTLRKIVKASEDRQLGAVRLSVTTRWPSVSLALAERLVSGVNRFILHARKSQAAAERQFAETQAGSAERALREAEDRLQGFLQRNRAISDSPELGFQRDRLQRDVALRQQVYTTLVQSWEEARIREVRDTPVITLLESPRLPVGEPRGSVRKGILGGLAGGLLGVLVALIGWAVAAVRRDPDEDARQFLQLAQEATPRFLRGKENE